MTRENGFYWVKVKWPNEDISWSVIEWQDTNWVSSLPDAFLLHTSIDIIDINETRIKSPDEYIEMNDAPTVSLGEYAPTSKDIELVCKRNNIQGVAMPEIHLTCYMPLSDENKDLLKHETVMWRGNEYKLVMKDIHGIRINDYKFPTQQAPYPLPDLGIIKQSQ